jgi:hypothetical protein
MPADLWAANTGRRTAGDQWSVPGRGRAPGPRRVVAAQWSSARGRPATSSRPPTAGWHLDKANLPIFFEFFFSLALHYLCKWSTLAGWLQHMPALARPCPKTSNTHNFWTVSPKIMKFELTQSLFWDASSQKVSKNLKIVWDHTTQPKSGLVTPMCVAIIPCSALFFYPDTVFTKLSDL